MGLEFAMALPPMYFPIYNWHFRLPEPGLHAHPVVKGPLVPHLEGIHTVQWLKPDVSHLTKTVLGDGMRMAVRGHDSGTIIPHIALCWPPVGPVLAQTILDSKYAVIFHQANVQVNGSSIGTFFPLVAPTWRCLEIKVPIPPFLSKLAAAAKKAGAAASAAAKAAGAAQKAAGAIEKAVKVVKEVAEAVEKAQEMASALQDMPFLGPMLGGGDAAGNDGKSSSASGSSTGPGKDGPLSGEAGDLARRLLPPALKHYAKRGKEKGEAGKEAPNGGPTAGAGGGGGGGGGGGASPAAEKPPRPTGPRPATEEEREAWAEEKRHSDDAEKATKAAERHEKDAKEHRSKTLQAEGIEKDMAHQSEKDQAEVKRLREQAQNTRDPELAKRKTAEADAKQQKIDREAEGIENFRKYQQEAARRQGESQAKADGETQSANESRRKALEAEDRAHAARRKDAEQGTPEEQIHALNTEKARHDAEARRANERARAHDDKADGHTLNRWRNKKDVVKSHLDELDQKQEQKRLGKEASEERDPAKRQAKLDRVKELDEARYREGRRREQCSKKADDHKQAAKSSREKAKVEREIAKERQKRSKDCEKRVKEIQRKAEKERQAAKKAAAKAGRESVTVSIQAPSLLAHIPFPCTIQIYVSWTDLLMGWLLGLLNAALAILKAYVGYIFDNILSPLTSGVSKSLTDFAKSAVNEAIKGAQAWATEGTFSMSVEKKFGPAKVKATLSKDPKTGEWRWSANAEAKVSGGQPAASGEASAKASIEGSLSKEGHGVEKIDASAKAGGTVGKGTGYESAVGASASYSRDNVKGTTKKAASASASSKPLGETTWKSEATTGGAAPPQLTKGSTPGVDYTHGALAM